MGVTVRQKDGAWWIFICHNHQRKAKKIGDRRTAEDLAKRIRARLLLGADAHSDAESPTLRDYAAEWLRTYHAVHTKPRTGGFYDSMLRNHILPTLGECRLHELSRRDVQRLIGERAATGLARNTLKGIVATLKSLCNHAIDQEIITTNPAARLGRFMRGQTVKEAKTTDAYTANELRLLLDTAEQHYPEEADLLVTLGWTGLRPGEGFGLQYPDIDYHGRFLLIQRTIDRRRKGLQVTSPKSGRQRRVAIPQILAARLAARRDLMTAQAALDGKEPPLWVFPDRRGKPKDGRLFARNAWYPLLRAAGLRHFPPHALRHTYASLLIQRGVSLAFIQTQLGHSSIQTTVDVYGHFVPTEGYDAIEALAELTKCNPGATDRSESPTDAHLTG